MKRIAILAALALALVLVLVVGVGGAADCFATTCAINEQRATAPAQGLVGSLANLIVAERASRAGACGSSALLYATTGFEFIGNDASPDQDHRRPPVA